MATKGDSEEIIALITQMKNRVSKRISDKITQIIELCYQYGPFDKTFTFDKNADLDTEVNRLLIELSDAIYMDFEYFAKKAMVEEEDKDKIFALLFGEIDGKNALYRIDQHSSDLKTILEAYLAIGFAEHISKEKLIHSILLNRGNLYLWDRLQKAFEDPLYQSEIIRAKGIQFGKGNNRNIEEAMALIGMMAIIGAYDYSTQLDAERNGAKFWTTIRGSNYDCGLCDSMVGVKHPISEPFTGFHPRCMCIFVPLYD